MDRKSTVTSLLKNMSSSIEWVKDTEYLGYDSFINSLDADLNYSSECRD